MKRSMSKPIVTHYHSSLMGGMATRSTYPKMRQEKKARKIAKARAGRAREGERRYNNHPRKTSDRQQGLVSSLHRGF